MISVLVKKQSNYPVNTPALKESLKKFLKEKGIVSDAEISVAIVGEAKIKEVAQKFLGEKEGDPAHNVLSFTQEEKKGKFVYPPDSVIYLGEILICYPKAAAEASQEGKLVNEKIYELIEHGALHLLGIHHE